jgi:hypothetical protein
VQHVLYMNLSQRNLSTLSYNPKCLLGLVSFLVSGFESSIICKSQRQSNDQSCRTIQVSDIRTHCIANIALDASESRGMIPLGPNFILVWNWLQRKISRAHTHTQYPCAFRTRLITIWTSDCECLLFQNPQEQWQSAVVLVVAYLYKKKSRGQG